MKKTFTNLMAQELNGQVNSYTENGALGYSTSGKKLLDMNFKMSSYRNRDEAEIIRDFTNAFFEQPLLAMKFLFFIGDIRQGLGERRTFKTCLRWVADNKPDYLRALVDLIPEYSRWDVMVSLLGTKLELDAVDAIADQLAQDLEANSKGESVSLLAKWLPSVNTSSRETRETARKLCKLLETDEKAYRKNLSALRKTIDVVERKMSAKDWKKINYETVPSKANLKYASAFMRNDTTRREQYLEKLTNGEAKINSSVAFPHDIIHKIDCRTNSTDLRTYNEMWKALPNYITTDDCKILVVVDTSGSMQSSIGNTSIEAHEVANALGIYFAERLVGPFKDQCVTFSDHPHFIDLSNCENVSDKHRILMNTNDWDNSTNIEAVFDLVLQTAKKNRLQQKDLPTKILILSDMEFNRCAYDATAPLFKTIGKKFEACGYKLPGLVFWNIDSKTNTVPIQTNENGVALVSGFSPTIASMVLSGKLDPFQVLLEKLNSKRYKEIETRLKEAKLK